MREFITLPQDSGAVSCKICPTRYRGRMPLTRIAQYALDLIQPDHVVGLGTGRAATAFIQALGQRVRDGLHVRGVPTSEVSAALARQLGIQLTTLADVPAIDVTVDGADEVDPQLNLIKGYGGALVREKIVAASSRREVILVGTEKIVPVLGTRGRLPVEVVPFGLPLCMRRLGELGCRPTLRQADGRTFVSDNGNYILDCALAPIADPDNFESAIRNIPGVVETGLFIGMADTVLVENGEQVEIRERRR